MVIGRLLRACMLLLALACAGQSVARSVQPPVAQDGVLDLSAWRFERDGPVGLDGQWQFVPGRLVGPAEPWPADGATLQVPGSWQALTGQGKGLGTYRLQVGCQASELLAMGLPFEQSAASVHANGRLVARQGVAGEQGRGHVPANLQQLVLLEGLACPLELRVQVSNFEMFRGGLMRSIQLGAARDMAERRELAQARALIALGAVGIVGVFALFFYLVRRRDPAGLYFGLFCMTSVLSLGLSGERVLQPALTGLDFGWQMRLLLGNWFGGLAVYALLLRGMLPRQTHRAAVAFLASFNLAGVALCLATPVQVFAASAPLLRVSAAVVGLYILWVLLQACRQRERGAFILLGGVLVMLAASLHDILRYDRLFASGTLPYGIAAVVLTPALLLAQRLARALSLEELRAQEQRLRVDLLVRATQAGVLDWNAVTGHTSHSERYLEMLGLPPGREPPPFRDLLHPEDRDRVHASFLAQLRNRGVRSGLRRGEGMDYRMVRPDGATIWVHAEAMSVCGEDGRTLRYICTFIDISHLKATEEALATEREALRASRDQVAAQAAQLERQNEALKENVRLREEVERIGRHDLKTPLNSIVAVPRLLREERKLGAEADELLGIVERAGYRILSMVNLSLDLYKMEQGSYIFRPDAVDLPDLARKVMADVRMHAASKQVRLALRVEAPPYAWAEELLCYSLLANLLKNAVEASPEGAEVTITVDTADDQRARVRIHNRGAVPEAIRGSFFQKYTTLGKASGTGLGTYSAWLMARVQDGEAHMETSDAAGTTLTVLLRAAPPGKVPAAVRHADVRARLAAPAPGTLPALRVLLVDDDEYNLLIVRRLLPVPPFVVDTAINGRVALSAAELQWPALVFMDLDMPVMGGLEAVGRLRALQRERRLAPCRMVALSSHDDPQTQERALAAGFDRYLTKPVTREMIHQVLAELQPGATASPAPAPRVPSPAPGGAVLHLDPEIAAIVPDFLLSRRALLDALEAAARHGAREELRRIAHQLAGSFALYGFAWAGERSRWMEAAAPTVTVQDALAWCGALRRHLDTVDIRFDGTPT